MASSIESTVTNDTNTTKPSLNSVVSKTLAIAKNKSETPSTMSEVISKTLAIANKQKLEIP
jgi:hypothetical protein